MDETAQPDDFAAGYEAAVQRLLARIEGACELDAEWSVRLRVAVESVLKLVAAEPQVGRLFLIEPYLHGGEAQLRHEEALAALVELLGSGRDEEECPPLPGMIEEGLIGAAVFIVGRPLRAGTPEQLPALASDLTALLLTPYLGREEAQRVAAGGDAQLE